MFPSHKGDGPLSTDDLWRFRIKAYDAAGIVCGARLHDRRHAHASHAVMNRGSLHVTGRPLGHRRATTTNRSVHHERRDNQGRPGCPRGSRTRTLGSLALHDNPDVVPIVQQLDVGPNSGAGRVAHPSVALFQAQVVLGPALLVGKPVADALANPLLRSRPNRLVADEALAGVFGSVQSGGTFTGCSAPWISLTIPSAIASMDRGRLPVESQARSTTTGA